MKVAIYAVTVFDTQASGEALEVLSLRQGPVRHVRFLVHPTPGMCVCDFLRIPLIIV